MNDLIFITSVINIPNTPYSYTNIRSVYNKYERYIQTMETIETIRRYMKVNNGLKIMLIECSDFNDNEGIKIEQIIKNNVDYYINLWENIELRNIIYGISKSYGELTFIDNVIKYIKNNHLIFNNIYKISGRYTILPTIDMSKYNNNLNVFNYIKEHNIVSTIFYKIPYNNLDDFNYFLNESKESCKNCIGLELIFMSYIHKMINNSNILLLDNNLSITGNIAVDGNKI